MKFFQPLLFLFLTSPLCWGAVDLKLPDKVKGEAGDFIKVTATTNGKTVKWVPLDKDLKVFPTELLKDSKTAVVTAKKDGTYRLMAYTGLGDEVSDPQITTVVVGTEVKPPLPPSPDDLPLVKSLKEAYKKAPDAKALDDLQSIYGAWATAVADKEKSATLKTWLDLLNALKASANVAGLGTKLMPVREALAAHFKTKFPADKDAALDDAGRALAATVLKEVADALKGVTK